LAPAEATARGRRAARTVHGPDPLQSPGSPASEGRSQLRPARPVTLRVRACFQPRPDRPSPQSQSFSRSYGSGLPTSLTYIVLLTRGCSPWRPAAVMGTTCGESLHTSPGFSRAGQCNTGRRSRRGALRGRGPYLRANRFQGSPPLTKKRQLFPGLRPASPGSIASQLWPP